MNRRPFASLPLPLWTGAAAAVLYLSFPAARFNFDGVACAIAVELGDLRHLVHGNHLLYGALGRLTHLALGAFGYRGPAIASLQILSSLLGAAGVAGFTALLLRLGFPAALAAAAAGGMAVSRAYWTWSLESQVYPLGAAFLLWAAAELAREEPGASRLGSLHAGAMVGHAGHAVFAPAILASLKPGRSRRVYLAAAAAAVVAAYALAVLFFVRPRTGEELRVWLLGSAALRPDRRFQWHGGYSLLGVRQWLEVSLRLFSGRAWVDVIGWVLAIGGGLWARRRRPFEARLAAWWLAAYAVLYLAWEPYTVVYRYTDVPALWLLIACAAEAVPAPAAWRAGALAALVAALGAFNWVDAIRPGSDPANNPDLQAARWIAERTPENAWLVVDGIDQVYVPYFAHRRPLNIRYAPTPESLRERVRERLRAREPVFAIPERLPAWAADALLREKPRKTAESRHGRIFLVYTRTEAKR